jgi:thiol-disulfide isomerase/thioredoxin
MNIFQTNFTKVIDYSKNLEKYDQKQLYNTIVDLRSIHGEMLGGFYNNVNKDLNNNETKLELSFLDSMIDSTRKILQLAESKFNMNDDTLVSVPVMRGGKEPKKLDDYKNKPMLMLFHAKWCGHCVHFMPTYLKLEHEYVDKSMLNIVSIEEGQKGGKELVEHYEITGFPTIKLYDGKGKFHEYNGGRDINNIREFVNRTLGVKVIKG